MRLVNFKYLALALLGCAAVIASAAQPAIGAETSATSDDVAAKSPHAVEASGKPIAVSELQEPQPPSPVMPLTPEELPPTTPQVRYQDGQLTIESENSTLGDIILLVSKVTGAQLETPPGFGTERVATRLGPGPASDVVSELLYGSKFGLVIVGTPENPNVVQKILITKNAPPAEIKKVMASAAAPPQTKNVATASPAAVVLPTATNSDLIAAAALPATPASVPDAAAQQPKALTITEAKRRRARQFPRFLAHLPQVDQSESVAELPPPEIAQPEPPVEPPPQ